MYKKTIKFVRIKQGSRETDWNLRLQFTRVKSYFDYGKQKMQIPLKIASGTFHYNSKKDKDYCLIKLKYQ